MDRVDPVIADAFRLAMEGGEIVIDFGHLERDGAGAGPASISVSDRVTMSLETSQRLLIWLEEALRPHAARLRAEDAKTLSPAEAAIAARPGQAPARPAADQSGEHAARLLRLVGGWNVPHQYERSFRVSEAGIQANRFLLTLNTRDIPDDPMARVLDVCDRMSMPAAARQAAAEQFGMAHCVHFGFEGDAEAIVCKLYLERAVPEPEDTRAAADGRSVLLHLAFKWDLRRAAAVTSRYSWFPGLDAGAIAARMAHVYRGASAESLAISQDVLGLAAERVPAQRLQYLEVEEPENNRSSFDLNVYNADLRVKDIQGLLQRMRIRHGIRPGQFQALYDQIKAMSLGHLAGGVHRDGKDFFNLYYGAMGLPRFGAGGGQAR